MYTRPVINRNINTQCRDINAGSTQAATVARHGGRWKKAGKRPRSTPLCRGGVPCFAILRGGVRLLFYDSDGHFH